MIKRLHIHNFRCFENFNLSLGHLRSVLLLGTNGAGKTSIGVILQRLQSIARGGNRVKDLVSERDFANGHTEIPVRIEIEAVLAEQNFSYSIAFELPSGFRELRVLQENLSVDGTPIYTRERAQVWLARSGQDAAAKFRIDWHLVALPIVQEYASNDPLSIFKTWLRGSLILNPVPSLFSGDSDRDSDEAAAPDLTLGNLGAWFSDVVAASPAAYSHVSDYLRQVMPDFDKITNQPVGRETRSLQFHFRSGQQTLGLALEDLSDGEKCFVAFAVAIAANDAQGPLLCFWDEPDNYLAPSEVSHAIMSLRRAFKDSGQLIVTSHNPETIRRFSDDNTLYLSRNSHLEPTACKSLDDLRASGRYQGNLVDALLRGDIDA